MSPTIPNNQTNILVVDDDKILCELLECILENEGYRVTTANNGLEALDIAKKRNFDLIAADVLMPVMDGFKFMEEVNKLKQYRGTPKLMFSTDDSKKNKLNCLEAGGKHLMIKPISNEHFLNTVNKALRD